MRVLVIGDSCIDVFEYGTCSRLCPEAPVPVFVPEKTVETGGMASNVKANIEALGVECDILTNHFKEVKKRYVDEQSNHMFIRVDEGSRNGALKITDIPNLNNYDAVVISDYNKGFITPVVVRYIANNHNVTFLDSKAALGGWINDIQFLKLNSTEYKENKEWLERRYYHCLIVTKGKDGADYYDCSKTPATKEKFPTERVDVRDLSGAGDTFLAGLVVEYLKTNDITKAIIFANKCASQVVTQRGVVVVQL